MQSNLELVVMPPGCIDAPTAQEQRQRRAPAPASPTPASTAAAPSSSSSPAATHVVSGNWLGWRSGPASPAAAATPSAQAAGEGSAGGAGAAAAAVGTLLQGPVRHPELGAFFLGYDVQRARFVPNAALAAQYPEDCEGLWGPGGGREALEALQRGAVRFLLDHD